MQKWRPWEADSDTEWGLALEREAVIRPLTEQERGVLARMNPCGADVGREACVCGRGC